jgi:predicted ArsR family transcriptional regulator
LHPVRQKILDYLKRHGQATVTELADYLAMAPVSVRHHLDLLIGDNLVEASRVRRQAGAGRPKRLYALTEQADALFPNNYQQLARESLDILKRTLPPEKFAGVMTELAHKAAARAPQELTALPQAERLQSAIRFLNDEGYMAFCECGQDEILLHTCHCPYKELLSEHPEICQIDHVLIQRLTGMTPLRVSHMTNGGVRCTYKLIPMEASPQPDPLPELPAHV